MKTILFTSFLFILLSAHTQAKLKNIKGIWRCYTELEDTLNPDAAGIWYAFDDSMSVLLTPGYILPQAAGKKVPYEFKNNILKVYEHKQKSEATILRITVLNINLISFPLTMDDKTETVYLKREKR